MLVEKTLSGFTAELASSSPAPGGGSVSALAGSISASLVAMVCNLTIGKEKYKNQEGKMKEALEEVESLRKELLELVDRDTDAFLDVMAAFRLPKGSDEEIKSRLEAIQNAYLYAAELPMKVCRCCLKVMEISETVICYGNPNSASDAGVSILMAGAGAKGAALNVRINLVSISDEVKKQEMLQELDHIMLTVEELEKSALEKVENKILGL